jgi:hypothetical protein
MKRIIVVTVTLLLGAAGLWAQTAKVVQLSPQDAEKARQLYDAAQAAQKAYEDFRTEVAHKYIDYVSATNGDSLVMCGTFTPGGLYQAAPCPGDKPSDVVKTFMPQASWENGFDFSADFKYIVPANPPRASTGAYYGGAQSWNCVYPVLAN